ncbi:HNH endonuclease signature motif containing protein [Brevibacterium paucivorans]|uniref:HNH endonuclease n=1 Tax=Brevibacterium paucivorans TaxID=170994 RepID=A0A2N6VNC1_9MICO|nr:HNH endonuclease signature motif containing protein [Brevibacterium paucivorans]PMD05640.1 HNH endonuclease [Brevibacterium paucivorans]
MTTTRTHTRNDMHDGPAVELFETVKDTTRIMDEARVKQAEAVAAVISAHIVPLNDFTDGMHAVFTSNPGAGPLVTGGKANETARASSNAGAVVGSSFGATSSHTASVGVDDVVACVALPTGEVATVASVERVADELPSPTEGVLAKLLDCTRSQLVTRVRRIMTAAVLMPKLWSLAQAGVISFDRVHYTAGRVGRAGVCIPVFDDMLTNKRVDVPWKTYRRHVNEVLAMLTTPEAQAENAKRNRSVSYWVNDDGTATLSLTGPVLEMEAFYQRVRGTARAILSNHIEPFTATLTDEQKALFITENNGETTEVRVGDLGRVEVDDDRLMDQLTLDLITGAKPSTTLRVRVVPTGKQAPIKITYTKDAFDPGVPGAESYGAFEAGTPGMENARGDAGVSGSGESGSVWDERCEAKQAEQVYELELCVSMPEKEEWLRAQTSINLTVPVLHFLIDTPPPNKRKHPGKGSGKDPGPDKHRPESDQDPGRNHKPREQRTEEQAFGRHRTEEQAFMDQGSSAPPGAGPGAGEPVGVSSELDYGLPIKVDPDVRVPVMMNDRVPLDAKTADEVIAQAKWVYRMFTDPETGVVLESAPTKYYIPAALKRMVEARHPTCSAPWCATPAKVCEKDHIEPFNHEDPESGGLTVMENLHPLCKRHHQEKTQKRLRVDRMDDGSLACVFPRIGAMLVYPPESRINQHQYERLIEYFDTGDQDISHTINEYLATEPGPEDVAAHNSGNETVHAEAIWQGATEREYVQEVSNMRSSVPGTDQSPGQTNAYPREVADEYAIAGEVFNGDTRPWQPSEEPPPF